MKLDFVSHEPGRVPSISRQLCSVSFMEHYIIQIYMPGTKRIKIKNKTKRGGKIVNPKYGVQVERIGRGSFKSVYKNVYPMNKELQVIIASNTNQIGEKDIERAGKHEFILDEYKYTEYLHKLFPNMILPVYVAKPFIDANNPGNQIYSYDDFVPTYRKPSVKIRQDDEDIIEDYIYIINELSKQNLCYLDLKCSNICMYKGRVCILDNGPNALYTLRNDNLKEYYKLSGLLIGLLNLFRPKENHRILDRREIQLLEKEGLTFTTAIDTFETRLSLTDINDLHLAAINQFYYIGLNYVAVSYKTEFYKKMNNPYDWRLKYPLYLPNHIMNHYLVGNGHVSDTREYIKWLFSIGINPPIHIPIELPKMPPLPTPPPLPPRLPPPDNDGLNSMYE